MKFERVDIRKHSVVKDPHFAAHNKVCVKINVTLRKRILRCESTFHVAKAHNDVCVKKHRNVCSV